MARNISVVILVGGNGTRLQWVVADRPKALSELTQRRKVARISFPSRLAGLRAFAPRGLNPDAGGHRPVDAMSACDSALPACADALRRGASQGGSQQLMTPSDRVTKMQRT